ncbi:hypothetical protein MANES_01G197950v8 [Manihot esculenta]|uniref:Uncharacterized protein n=1 Tax=Manihot esculenta TaxID=3983 RepID=A0ACB7IEJ9_MANES|nr:hypothetical protein MANES_01G197950v8 [Manihot esculenta]
MVCKSIQLIKPNANCCLGRSWCVPWCPGGKIIISDSNTINIVYGIYVYIYKSAERKKKSHHGKS